MLNFRKELMNKLILICKNELPKKAYGIIAGRKNFVHEIYPFYTNLRISEPEIDEIFNSFGEFYRNRDRGFWIDPEEQLKVMREVKKKKQEIIAIYHSHRCLYAIPSNVDIDLHYSPKVLAIIVSLIDPLKPEVRAFKIKDDTFKEYKIRIF